MPRVRPLTQAQRDSEIIKKWSDDLRAYKGRKQLNRDELCALIEVSRETLHKILYTPEQVRLTLRQYVLIQRCIDAEKREAAS